MCDCHKGSNVSVWLRWLLRITLDAEILLYLNEGGAGQLHQIVKTDAHGHGLVMGAGDRLLKHKNTFQRIHALHRAGDGAVAAQWRVGFVLPKIPCRHNDAALALE